MPEAEIGWIAAIIIGGLAVSQLITLYTTPALYLLLERLQAAGQIDWRRAALDSATVPAKRGAPRRARTRRIAASQARSATSSRTPAARRLA